MGKLVLRKTILRNMIDRVWAPLVHDRKTQQVIFCRKIMKPRGKYSFSSPAFRGYLLLQQDYVRENHRG
jgi:hypothetical protein